MARLHDTVRARELYQRVIDLKRAQQGSAAASDPDSIAAQRALALLQ